MSNENQHPKVAILIAIITVVGSLGAALLANWDKVFLKQASTSQPRPPVAPSRSPTTQSPDPSPPSPSSSSSASTSKPAPIAKASSSVNLTGVWDCELPDVDC
jgi:hypothetical protein